MDVDLKVVQLLCSRLCHDLVGSAGAVNAGLEILQESGHAPEMLAEAVDLAANSGLQTTARLTFYRTAFGFAGDEATRLGELSNLAAGLIADGAISLDWPVEGAADSTPLSKGAGQLLLNLFLISVDCLPRGGTLGVRVVGLDEGLGLALTATGEGARLRPELGTAIMPDAAIDDLTVRTVQGYFTRCLATDMKAEVEVDADSSNQVRIATVIPG